MKYTVTSYDPIRRGVRLRQVPGLVDLSVNGTSNLPSFISLKDEKDYYQWLVGQDVEVGHLWPLEYYAEDVVVPERLKETV